MCGFIVLKFGNLEKILYINIGCPGG